MTAPERPEARAPKIGFFGVPVEHATVSNPSISAAPLPAVGEPNPERLRNTARFLRSLADKLTYRFNDETRAQIRREADYLESLARYRWVQG